MKKIIAILMIFVLTINILSISSFADNEVEDNMIDSQTNAEMQNMLEEKKTYTLDELQSEKVETQNQINESNAQIGLINEQEKSKENGQKNDVGRRTESFHKFF